MRRIALGVAVAGLGVFLLASVRLGRLERGGPPHSDVELAGRVPASFYLPGEGDARSAFLVPPAHGERPPALVLVHGFASDRMGLSSLARRLAASGYAVLAIDLRGHGENRNPFRRTRGAPDYFRDDVAAAVDFLRATPLVDGSRLALAGHSMGAGAVLDYATRDSGIDAAVLISGGWATHGPYRPPNALFLVASADPPRIVERVSGLAARLAGADRLEPGVTRGDPARGTAVRLVRVPGADHATIVWSERAAGEIVGWLDRAFGRARADAAVPGDPRLAVVLVLALSLPLVLPGLGWVAGRLVPPVPPPPAGGRAVGLLLLLGGLLATLPLLALGSPAPIVSAEVGDVVVAHLSLTGILLLVVLALGGRRPLRGLARDGAGALGGAAVATLGFTLLLHPLGVVVHRLTLTPERLFVFAVSTAALLPFAAAFQLLLRRGDPLPAAATALAGRALVLAGLFVGVRAEVLGPVVLLMVPALGIVFVLFEILAASLYAASRNLAALALVDAALLAGVIAAVMPVRI